METGAGVAILDRHQRKVPGEALPGHVEVVATGDRPRLGRVRQEEVDAAAARDEVRGADQRIVPARIERDGEAVMPGVGDEMRDLGQRREFGDVEMVGADIAEGDGERRRAGPAGAAREEGALAVLDHRDGELRAGVGGAL